jgi:hypothetical protein
VKEEVSETVDDSNNKIEENGKDAIENTNKNIEDRKKLLIQEALEA